MTELILFYGLLSLAVGIGGAYSVYLYRKHLHSHGKNHMGGTHAH